MMPLFILLIGILFIVPGVTNKEDQLLALLKSDFTGGKNDNGFFAWALAIVLIVAVGYYKPIRPISDAFLVLLFVILFISNKGIATQFLSQTSNITPAQSSTTP